MKTEFWMTRPKGLFSCLMSLTFSKSKLLPGSFGYSPALLGKSPTPSFFLTFPLTKFSFLSLPKETIWKLFCLTNLMTSCYGWTCTPQHRVIWFLQLLVSSLASLWHEFILFLVRHRGVWEKKSLSKFVVGWAVPSSVKPPGKLGYSQCGHIPSEASSIFWSLNSVDRLFYTPRLFFN